MNSYPQSAPKVDESSNPGSSQSRRLGDMTYQAVTVAAKLLLLGSLWVF